MFSALQLIIINVFICLVETSKYWLRIRMYEQQKYVLFQITNVWAWYCVVKDRFLLSVYWVSNRMDDDWWRPMIIMMTKNERHSVNIYNKIPFTLLKAIKAKRFQHFIWSFKIYVKAVNVTNWGNFYSKKNIHCVIWMVVIRKRYIKLYITGCSMCIYEILRRFRRILMFIAKKKKTSINKQNKLAIKWELMFL